MIHYTWLALDWSIVNSQLFTIAYCYMITSVCLLILETSFWLYRPTMCTELKTVQLLLQSSNWHTIWCPFVWHSDSNITYWQLSIHILAAPYWHIVGAKRSLLLSPPPPSPLVLLVPCCNNWNSDSNITHWLLRIHILAALYNWCQEISPPPPLPASFPTGSPAALFQ